MPQYNPAPLNKTSTLRTVPAEAKPDVQPHQSNAAPLLEKPVSEPLQQPIAEDEGMFLTDIVLFVLVLSLFFISVLYLNAESSLGEVLSIYVGNLAPSTQVGDMEQVFKAFGRLKPNGVSIRSRKVVPCTEI
jgi:hypothetical protein